MAKIEEIASKSPHFFRIILPSILQNGTLELPRAFVKEHGTSLSNFVALKLPTGAKSKIELRICDDRAWLHKGWRDFVNKYSIKCGYFLVFKYKGESRFNLLIFDLSTSEIEYPVPSARTHNEKAEKRRLIEFKKEDCDLKDESPHKLQKGTKTLRSGQMIVAVGGEGVEDTSAKDIVLERAKSFQSPNPHFIVMMGRFYITRGSLFVPANARRYFHGRDDNGVKLNGPDGRAWLMEYCVAGPSRCHRVNIFLRWKEFVEEYHLRVGDACVFERVDDKVLTFNVVVLELLPKKMMEEKCYRRISWKKNSIVVLLLIFYYNFSLTNLRNLFRTDSDCWPVQFNYSILALVLNPPNYEIRVLVGPGRVQVDYGLRTFGYNLLVQNIEYFVGVSNGWRNFVVDNNSEEEDACLLELFSQTPESLQCHRIP